MLHRRLRLAQVVLATLVLLHAACSYPVGGFHARQPRTGFVLKANSLSAQNSSSPQAPASSVQILSQCVQPGMVALTYDDGPMNFTGQLLDILRSNSIKATFFVNGMNWVNASVSPYRDYIWRAYKEGHQIASHTMTHPDLTELSEAQIEKEITDNDAVIRSIIATTSYYMRPPYGAYNDVVTKVLAKLGYKYLVFDIDPTSANASTNSFVILNHDPYQRYIATHPQTHKHWAGHMLCLHWFWLASASIDLNPTTLSTVSPWTQQMIDYLRSLNFTRFVTVAECAGQTLRSSYRS
ncbi:uncharacterized protein BJ171DRAFT_419607 [Polychytrium aggregatum]|uniref:uncharacterized protein n=1 Tax=Polychytrium aggregatum TaxID=110093 RepID=UPI0022FE03C1|nr:uncharacterized protein BJ171DRAFT_419607 [Polychytrium aggregatum]KAI9208480.1 hypothetical protein BJ171DRAFT_419607 [Polychytrium aggregatum]